MKLNALSAIICSFTILVLGCAINAPDTTSQTATNTGNGTTLKISIAQFSARTAQPDLTVAKYRLTATDPDGNNVDVPDSDTGSFTLANAKAGKWALIVCGFDPSENKILSGSSNANVSSGTTTNVTVRLAPYFSGNGSLVITVKWPAGKIVDSIVASVKDSSQNEQYLNFSTIQNGAQNDALTLPAGSSVLTLCLYASGKKISRTLTDAVQIFGNKCTSPTYDFKDSDFGSGFCVSYNSNLPTDTTNYNDSVPSDPNFYASGDVAKVLGNVNGLWTREYDFAGWSTDPKATVVEYAPDSDLTIQSADAILYAVWTPKTTHTITYHGNGNTAGAVPVDTTQYYEGDQVQLGAIDDTSFLKTGYFFAEWCSSPDGVGDLHPQNDVVLMGKSNLDYYAIWKTSINVIFNPPDITLINVQVGGPTSLSPGVAANFTSLYAGEPASWVWYLDTTVLATNNTTDDATWETLKSFSFTPTDAQVGKHAISLFVTDQNGMTYSGSMTVDIEK
jgi:hypothetical protein